MANPTLVRGVSVGQELWCAYDRSGHLAIKVVDRSLFEGEAVVYVGEAIAPTREQPYWQAPTVLKRLEPGDLMDWKKYGVIELDNSFHGVSDNG